MSRTRSSNTTPPADGRSKQLKPYGSSNEIQRAALNLFHDMRRGKVKPEVGNRMNAVLKTAAREIDHEISKERNQIAAARVEIDYLKLAQKPTIPALNLQGVISAEPTRRLGRKKLGNSGPGPGLPEGKNKS